ncbi:MAG: family 14 glycosylhydrolase [Kangiellaceae bacterium]|nr:family 14 glycosylhydrolase [Kangiellaceae bacterium]
MEHIFTYFEEKWSLPKIMITFVLNAAFLQVNANEAETANVMAPLEVSNWNEFDQQLATAKSMGINAVSVDIWWGKVEANGDQSFDWSYYDTIVQHIDNAGLHWVPIMSFHQCGGNVGDTCNIPIPGWIWNHYAGTNADDLKYRSEQNNTSVETVSLWQDSLVISEYEEFMNEFENHFSARAYMTDEINISMGPAGELRYPSYNSHDSGTGYPTRGAFQSYSEPAKSDFGVWSLNKYGSISSINSAWGFNLTSSNDINPPADANSFMNNSEQYSTQYGKDFIRWYHESLRVHGIRMMDAAISAFNNAFSNVALGYKIPGIHWQIGAPSGLSRSAEMAAGLIPSDIDVNADATAHGYSSIIGVAANYQNSSHNVILHFTALEMLNENFYPQYSRAQDLVFWVANGAADQNVNIKGENALSGGVASGGGWDNIENAFNFAAYSGLTILRIGDVTSGGTGQSRYSNFISNNLSAWYFSGSPNTWQAWNMVNTNGTLWEITEWFESNGSFKIRHSDNNWNESYPNENWDIWQGAGIYRVIFDSSTHSIQVLKL